VNTLAIPLVNVRAALWRGRVRGLFNGFGYATALIALLLVAYTSTEAVVDWVGGDSASSVRHFILAAARHHFGDMSPAPLIIVMCLNLAPRAGVHVFVRVVAASLLCALWRQLALDPGFHRVGWMQGFLVTTLEAWFTAAVCAYRADARDVAQHLLVTQIDRTRTDVELKRAQLQLAHAQIEPHFLFNALATVRALARSDKPATVEMLDRLIRYFEAALPRLREDEARLCDEMDLVEAYLGIYRLRMGTRLQYEVTLPANLAEVRVPSMMVLTLVENALKHGLAPVPAGGFIRVCASREHSSLRLTVEDSGVGMTTRCGSGMGLANVRQRLLLTYGEPATLTLAQASPQGVVAGIRVPMREVP
jgi:signal transduction histidine kinase